MRPYEISSTRIDCFCKEIIKRGTPLFYDDTSRQKYGFTLVTSVPKQIFIGVSLCDVVGIDQLRCAIPVDTEIVGSAIGILTKGKFIINLPKRWGVLPIGQPLYWDGKKYTWKKISVQICKVHSMRSSDGYYVVEIN